jgi:subtilisin family serine protease
VLRIEAVTTEGVSNTAELPTGQQVVVGVVDSGVDASHPEITYAGGRSWLDAAAEAGTENAADTDAFGHGERLPVLSWVVLNCGADSSWLSVTYVLILARRMQPALMPLAMMSG